MLDIKLIREDPAAAADRLALVGCEREQLTAVVELDARRRELIAVAEQMRADRKTRSKTIGAMQPGPEQEAAKTEVRELGERMGAAEKDLAEVAGSFEVAMLEDVPVGEGEEQNLVLREEGARREFDFTPLPHWELGERLGIIDFDRGVKVSGTRFYLLRGDGARLQRALISWMLDLHSSEHGYSEVYPPAMVRGECLLGTGNLPKFGDNLYRDIEEDFWWVPTAEVPVTNMYRDEVLAADSLPIKHVAFTPCFRREKMSAGRDVRGIKRGHQFDKVEMVRFVHPDSSDAQLLELLGNAEEVSRRLGIPWRVIQMCTGDLSFVAAMKYDVEMWAPGCEEWLEVSSCSNFRDFQARRANIRFKAGKDKPALVHTLNGSGLALPRVLISVLETYQRADGTVDVPEVLQPYLGGQQVIS